MAQGCCKSENFKSWFRAPLLHMSSVYLLYYWGENMWQFALGLYLVYFEEGILRLAAIFGFTTAGSILLFGGLLGSWVDKTSRLKTMLVCILVQDAAVALLSIIVFLVVRFEDTIKSTWSGGLWTLLASIIIMLSIIAQLYGMTFKIALERDWFVVIADGDTSFLARINAVTRSLDQVCVLLAPLVAGAIMTHVSLQVAALIIAGYAMVTVCIKYVLIQKLYKQVPQLATRNDAKETPQSDKKENIDEEEETFIKIDDANVDPKADTIDDKCLTETPANAVINQSEKETENLDAPNIENSKYLEDKTEHNSSTDVTHTSCDLNDVELDNGSCDVGGNSEVAKDLERGYNGHVKNRVVDSMIGEPEKSMSEISDRLAEKESQWRILRRDLLVLCTGWRVYARQKIVLAGMGLAFLYMTVLAFHTITIGYAYANGISESVIGILSAFAGVAGILGSVLYPLLRRKLGLEKTGIFGFWFEIASLTLALISVWLPGSPFEPGYMQSDHVTELDSCETLTTLAPLIYPEVANNATTINPCVAVTTSAVTPSIVVFLIGVILSRMGLWIADLTVAQLMQENVSEAERGVVNGVQNSLNMIFEIVKYVLVIILPYVQTYGILIILSYVFVVTGGILFIVFCWRTNRESLSCHSIKSQGHDYEETVQEDTSKV